MIYKNNLLILSLSFIFCHFFFSSYFPSNFLKIKHKAWWKYFLLKYFLTKHNFFRKHYKFLFNFLNVFSKFYEILNLFFFSFKTFPTLKMLSKNPTKKILNFNFSMICRSQQFCTYLDSRWLSLVLPIQCFSSFVKKLRKQPSNSVSNHLEDIFLVHKLDEDHM